MISGGGATCRCRCCGRNCWPNGSSTSAPRADFHALVVADQSRWVAALPLVSCRVGWLIPAGGLPCNPWAPCGDLLLDAAAADNDAAIDLLLAAAAELPWPLLWLNDAVPEAPRWQALLRACDRAGIAAHYHEQCRVGRVEIDRDWDAYQKRLAKNHRQAMNRAARRLAGEGNVQFEMFSQLEAGERRAVAARGVRGRGSRLEGRVGHVGAPHAGHVRLLRRAGRATGPLGPTGNGRPAIGRPDAGVRLRLPRQGVCFAHKIGYDPQFAAFSPGQLLFYHILERFHADGETRALDFMGPLSESLSRWRPATYGVGRVAIAPRRLLGRAPCSPIRTCGGDCGVLQ